jgi:hypothetical protein
LTACFFKILLFLRKLFYMLAEYHKLPMSAESSFLYKSWECEYFDKPWHFHKEYELVLINKSEGARFIGDKVDPLKKMAIFF